MKLALSIILLTSSVYATMYEGCANNKKDALFELSGNIKSKIQSNFEQNLKVVNNDESVETTVSSYINASSNLSLANIRYERKNENTICAYVQKSDQIKNTKEMLDKALLYETQNLPSDIDEKSKKLSSWIDEIKQLGFLLPVFMENSQKYQNILNKKEKEFTDLYTQTLAQSDSLVWRVCEENREKAKKALNKKLFKNKSKYDKKGLLASISSVFKSDEKELIDLFEQQVAYIKKENKECALIKKDELLAIANNMNDDVKRFNEKVLEKNPKKRYKQIENYFEHLNVAKALIELYPNEFNDTDFTRISNVKENLANIKKTIYPQFVLFHIKSEQEITIKLDNKIVENNTEHYVPHGEHSYFITTKNKCPISGTFTTDLFEDKDIKEDFSSNNFPTVLFVTDKDPNIVVDGKLMKPNIVTPIEKCSGEVRFVVKFADQNKDGTLSLSPDKTHTIELNFLTPQELAVFSDAKTKNFTANSGIKFSESLTPVFSKKLEFVLKDTTINGELELHPRGSFKYKSKNNFMGIDSFEYVVKANGETSSPKVVNITVNDSNAPKALITPTITTDLNSTKEIEKTSEVLKEKSVQNDLDEEKFQRFKDYVDSQEQNIEKLQKLKEKYPDMFERLLKEKLGN
ncbi:hypothetical protein KKG72_04950 [bacterium]|nr:hypothetical protein [bacterium]MBU1995456.1 hypothetical protein [bacterium]